MKKPSGWGNWKKRNPELHTILKAENTARRKQVKAKYVGDYLSSHPCVDCGESDPVVLDFDHVRGKKECDVNALVYGWSSLERLVREIKKCDVRCANCHRRRHALARIGGGFRERGATTNF